MGEPILLTTWPFGDAANRAAWPALEAGGSSLDAVEAVCAHVDDDESVHTVGYGGLPDRDGAVSLDGCVMQSPARVGSVCAVRRHAHPVTLARRVMEETPHVMLAGPGADGFGDACGFAPVELLAPEARARWERRAPSRSHDTVCCLALDRAGVLSGGCSSSGAAYKLPGRVGDSPIPGHGLYVDPAHGGAAATGNGELVMGLCSSFLAVEEMRSGANPLAALLEALERIQAAHELAEDDQVAMVALAPDGRHASAALRKGYATAVLRPGSGGVVEPDAILLDE